MNDAVKILADHEAEAASLGSILIEPETFDAVSKIVTSKDYHREVNQWIFQAIADLVAARKPLDTIVLMSALEKSGKLDEVGPAYIVDLTNATPTSIYAEHYAERVREMSLRRQAIAAAQAIINVAYDLETDVDDVLTKADASVTALVDSSVKEERSYTMHQLAQMELNRIEAAGKRVAAGLPPVDSLVTGLVIDRLLDPYERGSFYITAARPGVGKSLFAFTIAKAFAKNGHSGFACTLEMTALAVFRRLLAAESAIDSKRLKQGLVDDDEWLVLMEATEKLAPLNLVINDAPGLTLRKLHAMARRHRRVYGSLDYIVVDYLQLMTGEGKSENRQNEIAAISRGLKLIAKEFNCVLIALSQLSRKVEERADKKPMLSDLRDSGTLEQDSDVVDFLYREDYYEEDTDKQNILELIREKARDGKLGSVSFYMRKEIQAVRDLEVERTDLNDY